MRKKSHILLGWYLAEKVDSRDLRFHKKAFCYGNVLPDLKPSFVTVRHEYQVNFEMISEKIKRLSEDFKLLEPYTSSYWSQVGEIIHYVADYFTFPHNEHFTGSLVEHTCYEGDLKNRLKECILSGEASRYTQSERAFDSAEDVIAFIKYTHDCYMQKERCVEEDIGFIIEACYQVTLGVVRVMEMVRAEKYMPEMVPGFAV